MPKVSVIIPTYNCAAFLLDAVSSALSQSFKDLEILVVDDGSTDETEKLVRTRFTDSRVIYVKQRHAGLSSARNNGLAAASGEYIAFLDADDIFMPDKIEKGLRAFELRKDAGVVYTSESYFYGDDRSNLVRSPHEKLSGDILYFLKRSNFIHVSTVMLKKAAIRDARFDHSLESHEDWDFFLKLAARNVRFFYLAEVLTHVRVRRASMTAVDSVMDSSREIVGNRARQIWHELKSEMGLGSRRGRRDLYRYISSKARATLIGFPHAERFNRPTPFEALRPAPGR